MLPYAVERDEVLRICLSSSSKKREDLLTYLSSVSVNEDIRIEENYRDTGYRLELLLSSVETKSPLVFAKDFDEYVAWIEGQHIDPIYDQESFLHSPPPISFAAHPVSAPPISAPLISAPLISAPLISAPPTEELVILPPEPVSVIRSGYADFLVLTASRIAMLRSVDLSNKVHKFRSPDAMLSSEFFLKQIHLPLSQRRDYVLGVLPLLNEMDPHLHQNIVQNITATDDPSVVCENLFAYETVLRDAMELHREKSLARTLAIGNRTSLLLDPLPASRARERRPPPTRMRKEAILHQHPDIKPISSIWSAIEKNTFTTKSKLELIVLFLASRTRSIALKLDNDKRLVDAEMYNRVIQGSNPVLLLRHKYEKKSKLLEISKCRRNYILEHVNTVRQHHGLQQLKDGFEEDERLAFLLRKKHELDMHALDGYHQDHKDFYYQQLFPLMQAMREIVDADSITMTEELNRVTALIPGEPGVPPLIELARESRGGVGGQKNFVTYDPYRIRIVYGNPAPQRHWTTDRVVPNFSVEATRQADLLAMSTEGMDARAIVSTTADTLMTISATKETSPSELCKLAKILYTVVDHF